MHVARLSLSPRARMQIGVFLLAYLVYSAARWVTIGELDVAQANADCCLLYTSPSPRD